MSSLDQTNKRLCIIGESDPFLARLLGRFAEKSGLRIRSARTGEEVLHLGQRDMPTLVILEPELPGKLRGWEAARALRASDQTGAIPLIICAWLKKDEALALTGPVSAYLQKPDLHYEDFVAALAAAGVRILSTQSDSPA
jgi:DNA-binding response OmpR family regulator